MNPWGVAVWGEIARYNEEYGLSEEQLYLDELAEYEETKYTRKKMDELKTGKPEKNEQATSIMFSPDLLNEVSKK